jgi:hypothetical protein
VHEIGHFLDQAAFGSGGRLGSESNGIPTVMQAIQASRSVAWLNSLIGRKQVRLTLPNRPRPQILPVSERVVEYLREPGELFARAYAQFIATVSQATTLTAQLDSVRRDPVMGGVYHVQWDDNDFVPIARALEQELRKRQWIR